MSFLDKWKEQRLESKYRKQEYNNIYNNELSKARSNEIQRVAVSRARAQARQEAINTGNRLGGFQSKVKSIQGFARGMANPNLLSEQPRKKRGLL